MGGVVGGSRRQKEGGEGGSKIKCKRLCQLDWLLPL